MSLKQQARMALDSTPPFSGGQQSLSAQDGGHALACTLTGLDTFGCGFRELTVHSAALKGAPIDVLKRTGEDLSGRLTYLLEPISPIEIDAESCTVQLRSSPPQKDDDGTRYYELLVHQDGSIRLARYTKSLGNPRESVTAEVTREVFLRLVDDFVSAAP